MRHFRTATREQLIEALEDLPEGALVTFASDYGDHCHTQQAHRLHGEVEEKTLQESAYSDSGWAIEDSGDAQGEKVWVLS
jgi:hypothetical protein